MLVVVTLKLLLVCGVVVGIVVCGRCCCCWLCLCSCLLSSQLLFVCVVGVGGGGGDGDDGVVYVLLPLLGCYCLC